MEEVRYIFFVWFFFRDGFYLLFLILVFLLFGFIL